MTDWLIKTFVRDPADTTSAKARQSYGRLASLVGILCNLLLGAGKFAVGLLSGSIAISADAVNNLSDASSSIVSLIGFKLAARPADEDHPFGHARFEYLAGLAVAVTVLLIGLELGKTSLGRILHPAPVSFSLPAAAVLLASILVKLWLAAFNRGIGKTIGSTALEATAADSRNDVLSTGAVLLAAVIAQQTGLALDGWMGLAVAAFILVSGAGLVKDTIDPLLGSAPDAALVAGIHDKVMSYPGVLGVHDLMVHDYGPGRRFASLHVEMAAEGDVMESHDLIDNIERDLFRELDLSVVIHFDPIVTSEAAVGDLRHWMAEQVREIDGRLTIHDLRTVPGPTHTNVIFDCAAPPELAADPLALKKAIKEKVHTQRPELVCVITVEHGFAPMPHA